MSKVTISTVAERAGVSKSTVSHVINKTRFVEHETEKKVLHAIEILGYRPNKLARSFALNQTFSIGLVISDVSNPFYHQVIHGVENTALEKGYTVSLFNAGYNVSRTHQFIDSMAERRVDGLILMSSSLTGEVIEKVKESQLPSVIVDYPAQKINNCSFIALDFKKGIQEMITYLIDAGYEQFIHVGGRSDLWSAVLRRRLFTEELKLRGISDACIIDIDGALTIDGGIQAFKEIARNLNRRCAVFAVNDLCALGVLFEAQKQSVLVPDQFALIGVDNIDLGSRVQPSLSTVALPCYDIGTEAMSLMLKLQHRIHNEKLAVSKPEVHTIQTSFIKRDSVASYI